MIKINECLKYNKIKRPVINTLYTAGDDILVKGKVEFSVFGKVLLDGIIPLMAKEYVLDFVNQVSISIAKDSAIIFKSLDKPLKYIPENIPVDPVPEMEDSLTTLTRQLLAEMLQEHGLVRSDSEGDSEAEQNFDEGDFEDSDDWDDDYEFPIDTDSLVVIPITPSLDEKGEVLEETEEVDEEVVEPDISRDAVGETA